MITSQLFSNIIFAYVIQAKFFWGVNKFKSTIYI